jgi:O-antigen/teichoic acid export membrane protein
MKYRKLINTFDNIHYDLSGMSLLRKKSIVTIIWTYIGFVFGAANMYLFAKYLTPEYNGLTRILLDVSAFFASIATFGAPTLLNKFYPYYKDRVPPKENDLLAISLLVGTFGFLMLFLGAWLLKPLIVLKYTGRSPLFVQYYYLLFPLTFFLTYFNILEAHAWNLFKTVLSNFFKEVSFRVLNLLLLGIYLLHWVDMHTFLILFSLLYTISFFGLLVGLWASGDITITFRISKLTRRLWRKMVPYVLFILGGNAIMVFNKTFDSLAITSLQGLDANAVFALSSYLCTVIEVPQRSVVAISFPLISRAWKEKNMAKLADIYRKSSINLLLLSTFLFTLIWMNFDDAIGFLQLPPIYSTGKTALLLLAMAKIVELGTGVNGQIIVSSRKWKFEFYSYVIALILTIPVNYWFIRAFGLNGAGAATLICMVVFNFIRFYYLYYHYKLQPFTIKTIYAVILPCVLYFLLIQIHLPNPLLNMVVRSALFIPLFLGMTLVLQISEDAKGVYNTFLKRLKLLK